MILTGEQAEVRAFRTFHHFMLQQLTGREPIAFKFAKWCGFETWISIVLLYRYKNWLYGYMSAFCTPGELHLRVQNRILLARRAIIFYNSLQ